MNVIKVSDHFNGCIGAAFRSALEEAVKSGGSAELLFDGAEHVIDYTDTLPLDIHVSNTHEEGNNREKELSDSITRNTALLMENDADIVINGNGSKLLINGKITIAILKECKNITVKNITFDYVNPMVTEMTVIGEGERYLDCRVSKDSLYRIVDGRLEWYGANFAFKTGVSQIFRPKTGFTWRYPSPIQDKNARFEEIADGIIRINHTNISGNPYGVIVGDIFQMREPIREECGFILDRCENIRFENVTVHMMDGLGLIAQNCNGIALDAFSAYPSSGRTAACNADFMHFSGCRGIISIENGLFFGAHDDAINVHGTHLKIIDTDRKNNRIKLRFMHAQTFGIGGFEIGDEICVTDPDTLICGTTAKVLAAEEICPRELWLTLDGMGDDFRVDMVVENISATAQLIVRNNHFSRIPTRGILVSTRKPVLIENNVFENIRGAGVLIADDARSWYESGPVSDVQIKNNTYRACMGRFVDIRPECVEDSKLAVHKNIRITGNLVEPSENMPVLYAKNTDGLTFKDNIIMGEMTKDLINVSNFETDI